MKEFMTWYGWNAVNSICQVCIVLLSLTAIFIALKQISSKSKARLSTSLGFGLGIARQNGVNEVVPGMNITIANLGMAPIFISTCGVKFFDGKKEKAGIFIPGNSFMLQPGESSLKSMPHLELLIPGINDKVSLHDRVFIFVEYGGKKVYYAETKYDYAGFKFEYDKILKRAKQSEDSV